MKNRNSIFLFLILTFLYSDDFNVSSSIKSGYCSSYDFYDFSENLLDVNLFSNNVFAWMQYEYSNPPEIGFPLNDVRKFRIEYSAAGLSLKAGDIYEFWGRGLLLNQFDDQVTNFDNGTRGLFFEYNKGPLILSHLNGHSDIWLMGQDARIPGYNNKHNMMATRIHYDWNKVSLGLTQLKSNEIHEKALNINPTAILNHNLRGTYLSFISDNVDMFFEYVDKISAEKVDGFDINPNDTLKRGHGVYGNFNIYLGSWALSTEYKRYAFDASHTDFTADDYGNRINFQQMPTVAKEHNDALLGRLVHNYNYNDERGIQFEINGSMGSLSLLAQYAHLSRNHTWQDTARNNWVSKPIDNYLPGSDPSSLPYVENYFETSGYSFNDRLYFKIGLGNNKEVLKTNWFFNGEQRDVSSYYVYDTTYNEYDYYEDFPIIDSSEFFDTTQYYQVESKMWQESKAFTIPMEFNYSMNNGYTIGVGFQYQERNFYDRLKGNSSGYNTSDSAWVMENPYGDTEYFDLKTSKLRNRDYDDVDMQINRILYLSISHAPKWSLTITHDWTNAYDGPIPNDPYYNPLEALLYGDFQYFLGKRNSVAPPAWVQNRWVSAEFSYNITPSQRLSVMYGSIQGGLFCSNGICRVIPPFNDGIKLSYSASF
ncbi:MAG: hypothetical protein CMG55_07405 [Candidatus Marinimicrobia bacterium]|nr:hypothetical protein [Candidatus Neomarinimicrobiota bacterium]